MVNFTKVMKNKMVTVACKKTQQKMAIQLVNHHNFEGKNGLYICRFEFNILSTSNIKSRNMPRYRIYQKKSSVPMNCWLGIVSCSFSIIKYTTMTVEGRIAIQVHSVLLHSLPDNNKVG